MRITDLEGEVRRHVLREKSLVNADVSELMFLRTERDRLLVLTKVSELGFFLHRVSLIMHSLLASCITLSRCGGA